MSGARNTRRWPASGRRGTLLGLLASACLLGGGLLPAAARASFGFSSFDGSVSNQDGSPATQAGSHPFQASTSFRLNPTTDSSGAVRSDGGDVKDLNVQLPPGLIGDPGATPTCDQTSFEKGQCPDNTAVGQIGVILTSSGPSPVELWSPVWNLAPPPGEPAQFGFFASIVPVRIDVSVRTGGDYGLTTSLRNVSQGVAFLGSDLTFWGVPADPAHDPFRGVCGGGTTLPGAPPPSQGSCPANAPLKPFLTNPTSCLGPQTVTISADSWSDPGVFVSDSFVSHDNQGNPIGADGCGSLDFSPTFSAQPTSTSSDSPTGLAVDLHLPQNDYPTGLGEADLKDSVVDLPAGVSVNPAAANGLQACSPAQIGIDNSGEPSCPDASKIGTTEIDSPLLTDPLKGGVYLAQQSNNPFGTLLAIYITAEADGVLVKLAGKVEADPNTGQLRTTFTNNPQLPFSDFKLNFFGGAGAPLATPETCGTFQTTTDLTPWTSPFETDATPGDSFTIDSGPGGSGCALGFDPGFTAGTVSPQAGGFSPFLVSLSRTDADQNLAGASVTLPPGMLAKLAGVGECSDAQLASISLTPGSGALEAASPACPAGSQVGTVTTGAGVGPDPFFLSGKAYLTGPYKGAPYGLAVVVPAVAGPLDLGIVVVRQALYVDPTTAQVTDVSDPFPTILDGIPLALRRVDVDIDRPGFTVNPTSCDPTSVTGTALSTGGLSAALSSRFQVGGCQELGFSPKLSISLTGRGRTRSGAHPTLTATLTQPGGQANIRSARVALPLSLALDTLNSQHVCDYDVAQAVHGGAVGCPANTIVGQATAQTPLLDKLLSGPVYLVQGIRFGKQGQRIHTLPSLLIPLRGQIALDLRASSAVNGAQQLVTTFSQIPDAPVSKFTLQINGGRKGILVITGRGQTICGKAQVANAQFDAQSGKTEAPSLRLATPACAGFHAKRVRHARRHGRRRAGRRARRSRAGDRRSA